MKQLTSDRFLACLLFTGAGMIFVMIVLGGITRLTGSGLSIVEWQPFSGILPPLNTQDWASLFEKYKDTPEYYKINIGMELEGFQRIFWLEYFHRLWGRLIGLFFFSIIIYSRMHKKLKKYSGPLIGLWCLGALQGVVGWYMVKSGLVQDPQVSPYRLSAHLLLAIITYSWAVILGLRIWNNRAYVLDNAMIFVINFVFLTIFFGGLVAGHKAGLIYNTFPKMGETWIPDEVFFETPWWKDLVHNPATIQFVHRMLAIITLVSLGFLALKRKGFYKTVFCIAILQAALGVCTLLFHIPIILATLHQATAIFLLTSLWLALYQSTYPREFLSFKPF